MELEAFLADEDVVLGSDLLLDMQSHQEGAGAQSSGEALMAPASGLEEGFEPTEAELAAFLEDKEVALDIQSLPNILGCPPTRDSSEVIANANVGRQRVLAHREQEAVKSTPTPAEPGWLTAMFSSISSAPPEKSASLESASAPRVTEPDKAAEFILAERHKAAAAKAEREARMAGWEEWEAKKAARNQQRVLLEQQRAVLQRRQRQQQQQKAMQRLEQQQRRQQQQQKGKNSVQRVLHQQPACSSSTSGSGTVQTLAGAAVPHARQQEQQ